MKRAIIALGATVMSYQAMAAGSITINGKEVKNQAQLHTMIAKELNFPNSYGKNLDALYEVLSADYSGQTMIKIKSVSILKSKLGADYVDAMVRAVSDASQDNPKIVLLLE
jgi:ribonuclease inhibitor